MKKKERPKVENKYDWQTKKKHSNKRGWQRCLNVSTMNLFFKVWNFSFLNQLLVFKSCNAEIKVVQCVSNTGILYKSVFCV